jgi:hypothetical protein
VHPGRLGHFQQEFRRFLVKKADYSKQYSILALDFL